MIFQLGDVLLHQNYGFAAPMQKINGNTQFKIASITKSFVAACVVKEFLARNYDLHDSLATFSDDFDAPWCHKITPHSLLTHTTTISSYGEIKEINLIRWERPTLDQLTQFLLRNISEAEITDIPHYNGINYVLLTAILEKLTQQPFAEFLSCNLFDPLDMHASHFLNSGTLDTNRQEYPNLTCNYTVGEDGHYFPTPATSDFCFSQGSGGIISTISDLAKWGIALFESDFFTEAIKQKLFHAYVKDYCYGLRRRYETIYHLGYSEAANSLLSYNLDSRIGLVILSNVQQIPSYELGNRIFKSLGISEAPFEL